MKPTLQLKLSQQLTLTPQLQQAIRLLQLSTLEMNQEVERLLLENPLLEREESAEEEGGFQAGESAVEKPEELPSTQESDWLDNETPSYSGDPAGEDDGHDYHPAQTPSLREHLNWQLGMTQLTERDKKIVSLLIDALDDNGYLTQDLGELAAMLPEELEIDAEDLSIALQHLQHMDPLGVGARNLAECLTLQLKAMPPDTPMLEDALQIVDGHLQSLAAHDFGKLKKILNCTDDELRVAKHLITQLNPRPGSEYSNQIARYIIPDVLVEKVKGEWVVSLNPDAIPRLKVNKMYADILQRGQDSSQQQIGQQLQEAKWLIKNVQQRFETIHRVSRAIVERQHNFLEHGEVAMRPLVLREIAEELGLHESTVSRVTTQKFMFTPRGIFELKYFFGSHVSTEAGGECSSTAIRAFIRQLVNTEDARNPLSDSQISEILGKQGIVVARRTIAKYRESLKIPPVNLRKSL
ncbi:MAG: RNA polymerase factor sigma-54 [Burkholderiales bacterium]|nr:RNA polymerase factor sigma-54 [Burkholderiales bacterium]